jgi:hypothetical protein
MSMSARTVELTHSGIPMAGGALKGIPRGHAASRQASRR